MPRSIAFASKGGEKRDTAVVLLSSLASIIVVTVACIGCGSSGPQPDAGACPAGQVLRYESPGCGAAAKPVCGPSQQDACYRAVCSCQGQTISRCDYAPEPFSSYGACPVPEPAAPDGGGGGERPVADAGLDGATSDVAPIDAGLDGATSDVAPIDAGAIGTGMDAQSIAVDVGPTWDGVSNQPDLLTAQQACLAATNVTSCDPAMPSATVRSATGQPYLAKVEVTQGSCAGSSCAGGCEALGVQGSVDQAPGATCAILVTLTDGSTQTFSLAYAANTSSTYHCCGYPLPPHNGQWVALDPLVLGYPVIVLPPGWDGGIITPDAANPASLLGRD